MTAKQYLIILSIGEGLLYKQIARKLFLSEGEIKRETGILRKRFNCKNKTALAVKVALLGL